MGSTLFFLYIFFLKLLTSVMVSNFFFQSYPGEEHVFALTSSILVWDNIFIFSLEVKYFYLMHLYATALRVITQINQSK